MKISERSPIPSMPSSDRPEFLNASPSLCAACCRSCGRRLRALNEDLGKIANSIYAIIGQTRVPEGLTVTLRGMVQGIRASFTSFTLGLGLAVILLFLILVAQFQSFLDPFIILLAVPPGLTGVMLILWLSGTTLNVMSLMEVVMLVGIAVSNSILIVEFTRH